MALVMVKHSSRMQLTLDQVVTQLSVTLMIMVRCIHLTQLLASSVNTQIDNLDDNVVTLRTRYGVLHGCNHQCVETD